MFTHIYVLAVMTVNAQTFAILWLTLFHEFWIEGGSLSAAGLEATHVNLNDATVEGFRCAGRGLMGVLFHPEAEPGARDSLYLFDRFHEMMMTRK